MICRLNIYSRFFYNKNIFWYHKVDILISDFFFCIKNIFNIHFLTLDFVYMNFFPDIEMNYLYQN